MLINIPRGWELKEASVTPEHIVFNRRSFLSGAGATIAAASLPLTARAATDADPTKDLYPVSANPKFADAGRKVTPEDVNTVYNNFYEFGSSKKVSEAAQKLPIRPWSVVIDGEVEKPQTIAIDDLIRKMPLEERIIRHRCVEAWSMVVPWSGFQLSELVKLASPLSSAKYVRMETFKNVKVARGQLAIWYPWPYVEALTIEEATNELAFMVTGAYGKPLHKQFGAPIRLHVPWKYGFKSIKSIVRISFTSERPKSFWETINAREYGFWANVNPEVPHPRWSQATERVLGTQERVPTQLYNGYGEYVAHLYKDLKGERLFM